MADATPLPLLSLSTLARVPAMLAPRLDPRALTVGIVHLGVGAFHRAHQVALTEQAAWSVGSEQWGICAASERSAVAADLLAAQDGLFSLRLASAAGATTTVLASLRVPLFAGRDASILRERLADPAVHVVTVTVTEKGYRHDPRTGRLRLGDPELQADLAGREPQTVVGQLVGGLRRRHATGTGPLSVISCDNLPSNGRLLGNLVTEYAQLAFGGDRGFASFISEQVRFPCSVADRIVPASTAETRAVAGGELGLKDRAALTAEPFAQWVLEDSFLAPRPPWERAGALLVADVAPYESLKLRVLNGTHSALAYLGLLAGIDAIAEAAARAELIGFVRALVDDEVGPTLTLPPGVDLGDYRDQVLARFANPLLTHRTLQVASDGSQKLPQRLLEVVRERLAAGSPPHRAALVVAAYLQAVVLATDRAGTPIAVEDPSAGELRTRVGAARDAPTVARRALAVSAVFGDDLGQDRAFVNLVASWLTELAHRDPLAVAAAAT